MLIILALIKVKKLLSKSHYLYCEGLFSHVLTKIFTCFSATWTEKAYWKPHWPRLHGTRQGQPQHIPLCCLKKVENKRRNLNSWPILNHLDLSRLFWLLFQVCRTGMFHLSLLSRSISLILILDWEKLKLNLLSDTAMLMPVCILSKRDTINCCTLTLILSDTPVTNATATSISTTTTTLIEKYYNRHPLLKRMTTPVDRFVSIKNKTQRKKKY